MTAPIDKKKCQIEGCQGMSSHRTKLCDAHYSRLRRYGDLLLHIPVKPGYGKGKESRRWAGGQSKLANGRVLVYKPDHPRANSCGLYVYRYVLVAEKARGRYLRDDEVVHHINGDYTDDRSANLAVLTRADHTRLHLKGIKKK